MLRNAKIVSAVVLAAGSVATAQSLTTDPPNNGSGGIFMDLTPTSMPLDITSFEVAYTGPAGTLVDVEVWTRPGTYVGFDASSTGWTLHQAVTGTRGGAPVLTPLPLNYPLELPEGVTTAVYLHCITGGGGINYQGSGSTAQTQFQNADLQLFSDVARLYEVPFGGSRFTPRAFAGVIHYQPGGSPTSGACCFADGTCQELLGANCFNQGGDFQGVGTECATANCPQPAACCLPDGSCQVLHSDECDNQGGSFNAGAATCAAVNCPEPCDWWRPLGMGMNGTIYSLAVYNGELIAAGDFTMADGQPAGRIAAWNGSFWRPLGLGMNAWIFALTTYDGELIAGGNFTTADGQSANYIAAWDGAAWRPLGTEVNNRVYALETYDGELIAAGSFTAAGGQSANRIAAWDGAAWRGLGSGMNSAAVALGLHNTTGGGELIAGGYFTTAGGQSARRIAAWDGAAWRPLGGVGPGQAIRSLKSYNGELITGGEFFEVNYVAAWDGAAWRQLGSGMDWWVMSLAVYRGELIAGGLFTTAGGQNANHIAAWDGTAWRPLGAGLNDWVERLTIFDGELIAGGWFTGAGSQSAGRIAAWRSCITPCYPNCDSSTVEPILNVDDFTCFINEFAAAQSIPHEQQLTHYANCDHSTTPPVLNVDDFTCFINAFAAGCP